jgi:predicted esterase
MRNAGWIIGSAAALAAAWGCGGSTQTTSSGGAGGSGGTETTTSTTSQGGASTGGAGGTGTTTSTSTSTSTTSTTTSTTSTSSTSTFPDAVIAGASCASDPPAGAAVPPPPKPYSGGACPALVDGFNTIKSSGADRKFRLVVPSNLMPDEHPPILFLWHWLGGSADDFYQKGEVQAAVDQQRFIAVIPEAKGDLLFKWPFESIQAQPRMDEEFAFFDDMLSCVSAQYGANLSCVSSIGVSAGALFTDQLAGGRGDYLASIVSLSGGVGGLIRPWGHPAHHMPALVLWGGSSDICVVINFQDGSKQLEMDLTQDGNFILECLHNCGHSEPPFDAPPGGSKYSGMWQFVLDHPYWLPPGKSPYTSNGFPDGMPTWCGIGPGSAVQRVGPCSGGGC